MKLVLVLSTFLGLGPSLYGQLTVKPTDIGSDTYLYVNNTFLYVAQEVNLQKNADESVNEASIYLRKEAQLIQGEGGANLNTGNGLLSVFQEGTSNAYDYNYWSSPVSVGGSGNGYFGIGMLYRPVSQTKSERAKSTSSLDGTSNPLTISNRWIHTYSGTSYSNWTAVLDEPLIQAGYGFSMKGVNGTDSNLIDGLENNPGNAQRYDFRGRPNNAPVKISVQRDKTTLIGNPFPSALDLSLFLLQNSGTESLSIACGGSINRKNAITGVAYFWDSVENGSSHYLQDYIGGYGVFSPIDPCTTGLYERPLMRSYTTDKEVPPQLGKHYERRFLPIGQGFMVRGASDTELIFHNHQRIFKKEGEHSDFKQKENLKRGGELISIPKLRLQILINDTYTRSLSLAFWPSATSGNDFGMDAEAFDLAPTDIGWNHNGSHFIIDVRPFEEDNFIPLIVKVDEPQAQLKITLTDNEGVNDKEIFLVDREFDIYYPILEGIFQVSLDKGNYPDRFFLSFLPKLSPPMPLQPKGSLLVHQNKKLQQIEIANPEGIPIQQIEVYDLTGKKLHSTSVAIGDFYSISTEVLANSVYIVHLITAGSEKIVVKVPVNNSD